MLDVYRGSNQNVRRFCVIVCGPVVAQPAGVSMFPCSTFLCSIFPRFHALRPHVSMFLRLHGWLEPLRFHARDGRSQRRGAE